MQLINKQLLELLLPGESH